MRKILKSGSYQDDEVPGGGWSPWKQDSQYRGVDESRRPTFVPPADGVVSDIRLITVLLL